MKLQADRQTAATSVLR